MYVHDGDSRAMAIHRPWCPRAEKVWFGSVFRATLHLKNVCLVAPTASFNGENPLNSSATPPFNTVRLASARPWCPLGEKVWLGSVFRVTLYIKNACLVSPTPFFNGEYPLNPIATPPYIAVRLIETERYKILTWVCRTFIRKSCASFLMTLLLTP